MKVTQSCPTLCNPIDYTVHEILQARILEWVAFPFSRGSSQPRDGLNPGLPHCKWILYHWVTREAHNFQKQIIFCNLKKTVSKSDISEYVLVKASKQTKNTEKHYAPSQIPSTPSSLSLSRRASQPHASRAPPLLDVGKIMYCVTWCPDSWAATGRQEYREFTSWGIKFHQWEMKLEGAGKLSSSLFLFRALHQGFVPFCTVSREAQTLRQCRVTQSVLAQLPVFKTQLVWQYIALHRITSRTLVPHHPHSLDCTAQNNW